MAVPAHFDAEVYGVFRRLFRRGLVDRARFDLITRRLIALSAERVALTALLADAHRIADQIAAPDAFYVALARARRITLVTADARLERVASKLATVHLIA